MLNKDRSFHGPRCDRCGKEDTPTTMSVFNTEVLCMVCKRAEMQHPGYEAARNAETEAVIQGNFNFPGVGKPGDLKCDQEEGA